ncbi:MAG TPA: pyridoxal-dependent decarboxylase [Allosphingosinicella sp.]
MSRTLEALEKVLAYGARRLSSTADSPVAAASSIEKLRSALDLPLPADPLGPELVTQHLIDEAGPGMVFSAGGRFFGWVMGGTLPAALAADWLVSLWDQNAAITATSPGAAVIEEVAGRWVKELLGLAADASFAFTTGCQMSHTTCLAAARHSLLADAGWAVERRGLFSAPPIRIVTGSQKHASVERSLRLLGFGLDALRIVPEEDDGTISEEDLRSALAREEGPAIVILNAGDLNIGAFDRFSSLIPIAKQAGAWVHVDGAFGLWLRASRERRHLVEDIDLADSWATDSHKWLNVPYDSGIAIVRHPAAHRAAMTVQASYIAPGEGVRDAIDWTPEWSRRARAVPTYAALRELGASGLADLIDRTCDLTHRLATGIGALDGAVLLRDPQINQALVRFEDERAGASADDGDRRTDRVIELVNAGGSAFFTATTWRGRRAMRISLCNWQTNEADVRRVIRSVAQAIAEAGRA